MAWLAGRDQGVVVHITAYNCLLLSETVSQFLLAVHN